MNSRPVWITGAGGLIGSALVRTAPATQGGTNLVALTRGMLDLTDAPGVKTLFRQHRPAAVIHCAAMSKSTECQAEPQRARLVNVEATARLAELAAELPFIFLSTDLVFDGRHGARREDDPVNPLSIYAETKVLAEQAVRANPRHTIVRTSLNGGISPTGDRGFNELLYREWRCGGKTKLFTDEFRSPIAAVVTARAIWELLRLGEGGTCHVAGSEKLSRWQIGELLAARHPELNPRIEPGSLREYSGPPRAPDTSLDCGKVQALLSFPLAAFSQWLEDNPQEPF
jgi:dTDP-4-dehydrorhamnose reductase